MKPDFIADHKPLLKPSGRWIVTVISIAALTISGLALRYVLHFQPRSSTSSAPSTRTPPVQAVSALGHLRPEGEVIYLSPPTSLPGMGTSRVAKLLVQEGDRVQVGQLLAVLDSYANLQAALELAQEEVKVAQAALAQVRAGAKAGEIEAQQAAIANLEAELEGQQMAQEQAIARLEAELENAEVEYQRYRDLFQDGAVTASQLDSKRLTLITAQEQLDEAQVHRTRIESTLQQQIREAHATLNQIAEVRPTDVQAAQADVNRAIASAEKARADLESAYVRSPVAGQVLGIHTRPGEMVGDRGIVSLGQTRQMYAIAEVYELDIHKVNIGQTATITSSTFPEKLQGTVTQVGLQVNPQEILSTNPAADVNRRIVEVKIRLNEADSQKVANLTNLQVNVVIDID